MSSNGRWKEITHQKPRQRDHSKDTPRPAYSAEYCSPPPVALREKEKEKKKKSNADCAIHTGGQDPINPPEIEMNTPG